MLPFRRWTDLPAELLCRVGDYLDDLKSYASARGACTAWRRALPPPSPSLLVVLDGDATGCCCPAARRSFGLRAIPSGGRCIGSSNGWLALSVRLYGRLSIFSLFHPVTADEIRLPPLIYKSSLVSKLVFAPRPARDDFAAAAICDIDRLAYVTAGARRWAILDPVRLAAGDQLADVVYRGQGTVYCLTLFGDVHVLRLPERRRREPIIIEDPPGDPAGPSARPALRNWRIIQMHRTGPDLNAPATVEPLLACEPFDAATSFAPPYNTLSVSTSAKNLVFCHGNLYQIWRNASCTVTLQLPVGGGHRRVAEDEIFVLRYDPRRRPCWDAVADLGGYSVFVGRNNAVSMYAEGVPGLKGNSVYWIGGRGRDQGMVFDMATGRSTPCPPVAGVVPQSTVCWYFLSDI